MQVNDDNFMYHIGDKVLFKNWIGEVKKGKIIGRRAELWGSDIWGNHIIRYYAIKTLFSKDDIKEDNIYGLVVRKG